MIIYSNSIINKYLKAEFGNNTTEALQQGKVKKSFHLAWKDLPTKTKSLAIYFYDDDAINVCGFSWIHWVCANINPNWENLPVNASIEWKDKFIQGKNSWGSNLISEKEQDSQPCFGGPAPPDEDHIYTIEVFALDKIVDLKNGFSYSDLKKAMQNHLLDSAKLEFIYEKIKK